MTGSANQYLGNYFLTKTWNVSFQLPVNFTIKYSTNILDPSNRDLLEYGASRRRTVVVDNKVWDLYGARIEEYFKAYETEAQYVVLDCSEEHKDMGNIELLLQSLEDFGILRRDEPLVAIGGGVLLDIAGFAASIYRRGIPYVRVPTTLLALVDASVGAKTAINHFERRNRLGSYYPPLVSYIDKSFVQSQSEREISNGLGEIFKLALIKDEELFDLLETHAEDLTKEKFQYGAVPVRVINRSIGGMVEELAPNLWENNLERCVDFGHSFSPLIEMMALPELSHGEAVALDCIFSSFIANGRNMLSNAELDRVTNTARGLKLRVFHPMFGDPGILEKALTETMRHRNNNQYLPLSYSIGSYVFCNDLTIEEITHNANQMKERLG